MHDLPWQGTNPAEGPGKPQGVEQIYMGSQGAQAKESCNPPASLQLQLLNLRQVPLAPSTHTHQPVHCPSHMAVCLLRYPHCTPR